MSSPTFENLLCEKKGAIAYVTLNRSKVLNALIGSPSTTIAPS